MEKRKMKTSLGEFEFTLIPRRQSWKKIGDNYFCPACNSGWMFDDFELFNFCPDCGADLRGETNEER